MDDLTQWYCDLAVVKNYLITQDPKLKEVFTVVDATGFQLHSVVKEPYTALLGAIIGQKISYAAAKNLRRQLYERYPNAVPMQIKDADLSFLGMYCVTPADIIKRVTQYILEYNIDLNTEEGIRSLMNVSGIGSWTIETTLLTCLKNWDLFPEGDKFLHKRLQRLYGPNYDIRTISVKWIPYRTVVTWYLWRWF